MRLRLAFKLHGEEAELARQISDAAGIEVDKIAKLAMQRYMQEVMQRAYQMKLASEQERTNGQPSNADDVHFTGVVPPAQDSVPSQEA